MKKVFLGLGFIALAFAMFYFTMPTKVESTPYSTATPNSPMGATDIPAETITSDSPQTIAACSSSDLFQELKTLKEERNKKFAAIAESGVDQSTLHFVATNQLNDHSLAQEYKDNPPSRLPESDLDFFNDEQSKEMFEELMMGALAGESKDYLQKFKQGLLTPLDPKKPSHRDFFISLFSMGGKEALISTVNALIPNSEPLPDSVLVSIIGAVKDAQTLKPFLDRATDINGELDSTVSFMNPVQRDSRLMDLALKNQNFAAADMLLTLGAKPRSLQINSKTALDNIYQAQKVPHSLLAKLLDRGFKTSSAARAMRLSEELSTINSDISAKFLHMSEQIEQQQLAIFNQAPADLRNLVTTYNEQYEELNQKYLDCIAEESQSKEQIPPYVVLNKLQINAQIDQLIAQKAEYIQIISTLAAQNKETVEHGYQYLRGLRMKNRANFNNFTDLPQNFRQFIGLFKAKKWDQMVEFMANNEFDEHLEISAASMIPEMIQNNAPESAIQAMAKISDKNDIKLIRRAQHKPELLARIAGYGFNLNANDESNKNLFYQAVKRNQAKQLETLIGYGVQMVSDNFGYDALDVTLRRAKPDAKLLSKLADIGFPITADHQDYALYLKTYYPERYEHLIKSIPTLAAEGEWQPKSL